MSAAPKWTAQQEWFTDDRWAWRREVETVSWWPATPRSNRNVDRSHTTTAASPWSDWTCICGQANWPKRTRCCGCALARPQASAGSLGKHEEHSDKVTVHKVTQFTEQEQDTSNAISRNPSSPAESTQPPLGTAKGLEDANAPADTVTANSSHGDQLGHTF